MGPKPNQKKPGVEKRSEIPSLKMTDPDWDDFWSHKIAEKAKSKVLSYFAVATLSVSLLITIYGVSGIKSLLEERLTKLVDTKSKEAVEKIEDKIKAFDLEISQRKAEVKEKTDSYLSQLAPAPREFQRAAPQPAFQTDLSAQILPIVDQGSRSATVGVGITYAVRCGMPKGAASRETLSWWGLYKAVELQGEGAMMNDALDYAISKGIYSINDWPIDDPSPKNGAAPVVFIEGWRRVALNELDDIKAHLKAGYPVLVGATISKDFYNAGPDGRVTIGANNIPVGGHVLTIVGYSESTDEFRFGNSWGTTWGDDGFGIIRADDLKRIAREAYVVTSVKTR
jgi:Papain family cysteine protease